MRDFTVNKSQDGLHVVKASQEAFPQLKSSDLFHALKRRDIRIDGKKINKDIAVKTGNVVEIWLPDELFDTAKKVPAKQPEKMYEIVAETKGLLIVNKFQGIAVHSGKSDIDDTLIDQIRNNTKFKDAELCHRIDMNTGGLVLIAKNKAALSDCVELFKNDLVTKRYRALVLGEPYVGEPAVGEDGTLYKEVKGFLEKTKAGKVYIHDGYCYSFAKIMKFIENISKFANYFPSNPQELLSSESRSKCTESECTPVRDKKHHNKRGQKVGSLMEILYLCICKSINYKNNHYDYRLQSYRIVLYYR